MATGINWKKGGIGEKGFPDNNEDMWNAIGPYSQILQMKKYVKTFKKWSNPAPIKKTLKVMGKKSYHL